MKRGLGVFCCVFLLILLSASRASERSEHLAPFSPAITHGDTRVTLLHVGRITSMSSQYVADNKDGAVYALPGVYVEYLVERLGDTPITTGPSSYSPLEFWIGGAKVGDISAVVPGGDSTTSRCEPEQVRFGFDSPAVPDPRRTYREQVMERGYVLDGDSVEIRIRTGFDGADEWYIFTNVPLY